METKNQLLSETALIKPSSLLSVDKTKKLGEGGYGVVYQGKYEGMDAAIKELLVQEFSQDAKREFCSEAQIMLQLRDPRVVHLYGITENPYQMVMEFCSLGSLKNYLQDSDITISWSLRFHLGTWIASGLHYLHTPNTLKPTIIHGDLKSPNVLLVGDPKYPNPKLADFGLARVKFESQSKSSGGNSLGKTVAWAAPELFSLDPKKTIASDMYAFAITLWEIASRTYPYPTVTSDSIIIDLVRQGQRAKIPKGTLESFSKIIEDCWDQDPKKRPSAKQALQALQQATEKEAAVLTGEVGITQSVANLSLKSGFVNSLGFEMASQEMDKANTNTNQAGSSAAPYQTDFVNSLNTPLEKTQKKPSTDPQYPSQTAQYKPVFQPEPKKVLSISEQVEQMSTVAKEQNKIRQEEVQALLKWVTEGHLVEVETLLKKNPSLGVCTGTIKDLSDRTFKNITALQYAAWSLDREMCDVIMGYVGTHNSAIQLKALYAEPKRYSDNGTHYDIKPLIAKTQTYVKNCEKWWQENQAECYRYWQKEVGGEQRKCPAWLIYAWSEEGKDVAWTKQDFSRKVKREYDKNRLVWWFTENWNNGRGVGTTWACARGGARMCEVLCWGYLYITVLHDRGCQLILDKLGNEQLAKLKSLSDTYATTQTISTPVKK